MSRGKRVTWLVPVAVVCAVFVGVAAWVSVWWPWSPVVEGTLEAEQTAQPILREWNGTLALFEGGNAEPSQVYEVTVAALPSEEQERLRAGIPIESETMLDDLLENYTS